MHPDFESTVQFLYSQLPMFQRDGASAYKKDLTNTIKLCEYLGHPEHQFKSIHIAGTNGKGSSSHFLAAILQQAGYKTGLYTSPHLKSFTERIKINGIEITQEAVVDFVSRIKPIIEEIKPSFFEITVAMCFDYFAKEQVDIAVIEVGMGGRLDSTNVILPEVSLITNISLDHQKWLGDSLEAIAKEKAGIIKKNRPVVISEKQEGIYKVFEEMAIEKGSDLQFAIDRYRLDVENDSWTISSKDQTVTIDSSSFADYQKNNILGVLAVIDELSKRGFDIDSAIIPDAVENAFTLTGLKGRWQKLDGFPKMYCDVGHNESGISLILNQISKLQFNKLHFILGVVNDKDITTVLSLLPKNTEYYFCQANIPRALESLKLKEMASSIGLIGESIPDVNEAISLAKSRANKDDLIFIGGSNFLVAEIENL